MTGVHKLLGNGSTRAENHRHHKNEAEESFGARSASKTMLITHEVRGYSQRFSLLLPVSSFV